MTASLRARLLTGIVAGMAVLLLVFGVVIYSVVYKTMTRQFDDSLLTSARMVASQVQQEDNETKFESEDMQMPEFSRRNHPDYFEVWLEDGTVLAKSVSLARIDLPQSHARGNSYKSHSVMLPNGNHGRVVYYSFIPRMEDKKPAISSPNAVVAVARESAALDVHMRMMLWLLLGGSSGVIAMSVLVAWLIVHHGLKPLNKLAGDIAAIDEAQLSLRLKTPPTPAEMTPVVLRLNDLLERLESAFNRERQFTAEVAHELRTPLAGLQSTLEVALTRDRSTGYYQEAVRECLDICRRLQVLVDNLLMLARLDARQVAFNLQDIQLFELVNSLWRYHADPAVRRDIRFDNMIPQEMICRTDSTILTLILSNLLANAAEYTDNGGHIQVTVRQGQDNAVELSVTNTSCKLSLHDLPHLFQRFWRADASRSGGGLHCGLGLALVRQAAAALGGEVAANVLSDGVFSIMVSLPMG